MYSQITVDERYTLGLLRRLGLRPTDIARALGRHRSTIGRELARNTHPDGGYRPAVAQERTNARRWRSRGGDRFTPAEFALVTARLALKWSPEQIAAVLRQSGLLAISHETIYRYIWADKRQGRVTGKRPITARPASIETRREGGHWEMDTVLGTGDRHCVLSLVERTSGYLVLGKLSARITAAVTQRGIQLIRRERQPVRTITADNGTEFHDYAHRASDRRHLLLRNPASRLGARDQREHQRAAAPVSPEGPEHGAPDAARLHPHRWGSQHPAPQAPPLSDPGGSLCDAYVNAPRSTIGANVALHT